MSIIGLERPKLAGVFGVSFLILPSPVRRNSLPPLLVVHQPRNGILSNISQQDNIITIFFLQTQENARQCL